jgi:hypothetical protein
MATSTRASGGFGRRNILRIEGRLRRGIRLAEYGEQKFPEKPLREYVTCVTADLGEDDKNMVQAVEGATKTNTDFDLRQQTDFSILVI